MIPPNLILDAGRYGDLPVWCFLVLMVVCGIGIIFGILMLVTEAVLERRYQRFLRGDIRERDTKPRS